MKRRCSSMFSSYAASSWRKAVGILSGFFLYRSICASSSLRCFFSSSMRCSIAAAMLSTISMALARAASWLAWGGGVGKRHRAPTASVLRHEAARFDLLAALGGLRGTLLFRQRRANLPAHEAGGREFAVLTVEAFGNQPVCALRAPAAIHAGVDVGAALRPRAIGARRGDEEGAAGRCDDPR